MVMNDKSQIQIKKIRKLVQKRLAIVDEFKSLDDYEIQVRNLKKKDDEKT